MTGKHLSTLARRLEDDPFFLGCSLRLYAKSEGLSEEQLATALGCTPEALTLLRLCRAPTAQPGQFQKCIQDISARIEVNPDVLTEAVRRGQALIELARPGRGQSTLAAARDADTEGKDKPKQGGGP
jgi:hypothetical protein